MRGGVSGTGENCVGSGVGTDHGIVCDGEVRRDGETCGAQWLFTIGIGDQFASP